MPMPNDNPDHYQVLHANRDAPQEIIRGCYRTLMQQLKNHPDLGGDKATAARINEAYAVLGNIERRAEYDAQLDAIAQQGQSVPEEPSEPVTPGTNHGSPDPFRECIFCESPHDFGKVIESDAGCQTCGSPLAIAENRRIEPDGQRSVGRLDRRQKITFYSQWPQANGFTGRTEDISLNGLRFVTTEELSKGQRIKIVCEAFEAVATVTHCINESYGRSMMRVIGVSFATLRFVRSIGGFVSEHV